MDIGRPPKWTMTTDEALILAAWLVTYAGTANRGRFEQILAEVRGC